MIERETERGGVTATQRPYYLCSKQLDAETLSRVVRSHCGIENHLHWVLDVVFHDDRARGRVTDPPTGQPSGPLR